MYIRKWQLMITHGMLIQELRYFAIVKIKPHTQLKHTIDKKSHTNSILWFDQVIDNFQTELLEEISYNLWQWQGIFNRQSIYHQ